MNFITDPMGIERRSMELIAPYLDSFQLNEEEIKIYSRIIHASGDPDYASVIKIHPEAIAAAKKTLQSGAHIYSDVEMVRTGINKKLLAKYGGKVECLIADEKVAEVAKTQGITRSMAAMRVFGGQLDGAILAIGNAPTALFEVLLMIQQGAIRPALIVGVPVGFVGASESKEELVKSSPVPYITVAGNKGGSPIAASIVNALLYMLDDSRR